MLSHRMIDAPIRMFRLAIISFLFTHLSSLAAPPLREVPNPTAISANQLDLSANACGPTALLNSFRFGNTDWQKVSNSIKGDTDKKQINNIILKVGMTPSNSITGKNRWTRKGVNVSDLNDAANDITLGKGLPPLDQAILFLKPGESLEQLLHRCHQLLDDSLVAGLPPILSVRRYALRSEKGGKPTWIVIDAHFVTLYSLPQYLDKGDKSFEISYLDPWGGKIHPGTISIPTRPLLAEVAAGSPCLEAIFPDAAIGKRYVRQGELTILSLAAAVGKW